MFVVQLNRLLVAAAISCIGCASAARADWAGCQSKPTRACVFEEALRGDSGPLTGKDRLDVLIQGGALSHPDAITAGDVAEAQGLAQAARNITGYYYSLLAIQGLVAANQKQQAIDLVTGFTGALQTLSITELVKDLVKAGDTETALALPDRMQPPPDPKARPGIQNAAVVTTARTLAETGKTDQALSFIAAQNYLTDSDRADLQAAVALAFAKKGDTKRAQATFDQAQGSLDSAQRSAAGRRPELLLRIASIRLLALRGQGDAAINALQQYRPSIDTVAPDALTDYDRSQGYQRIVAALLEGKQPDAALTLAKSLTPDATKEAAVTAVAIWYANNGRLADARTLLSSMPNTQETATRVAILRNVAIASAKGGDIASALRLANELHTPLNRRGTLFAIALALPQ